MVDDAMGDKGSAMNKLNDLTNSLSLHKWRHFWLWGCWDDDGVDVRARSLAPPSLRYLFATDTEGGMPNPAQNLGPIDLELRVECLGEVNIRRPRSA